MPKKGSSTDTQLWHLRSDGDAWIHDCDDYVVLIQARHDGRSEDNPHVHALLEFKKPVSKYLARKSVRANTIVDDYALSVPTTPQEFLDYVCWEYVVLTSSSSEYSPLLSEFLINKTTLYPNIEKSAEIYKSKHLIKPVEYTPQDVYQACLDHIKTVEAPYHYPASIVDLYLKKMLEYDVIPSQYTREGHLVKLWIAAGFREQFAKFEKSRLLKKYFELQ